MNSIEINNLLKKGIKLNIIDIRQKERYDHFHIEGAIHVEKGEIISDPSKFINKDEKYYITCNSGNSAKLVVGILSSQGFKVEIVKNGMSDLISK